MREEKMDCKKLVFYSPFLFVLVTALSCCVSVKEKFDAP